MRRYFKVHCLLLYLLAFLFFTVVGAGATALSGAADNQGLAGGAIVLFYGLITGFVAFVLSILFVKHGSRKQIIMVNLVLAVGLLILYVVLRLRHRDEEKEITGAWTSHPKRTELVGYELLPTNSNIQGFGSEGFKGSEMGMGFFVPNMHERPTLFFYGQPNLQKSVIDHSPVDSLKFRRTESGIESVYGPPWLHPEYTKLDYGIFYMKVLSVSHEMLEVEGNRDTGKRIYVDRSAGKMLSWPDFLLSVSSVEFPLDGSGKVYHRPTPASDPINLDFRLMKPIQVRGEWMQVRLMDDSLREHGNGWIRWKQGEQLLIGYSILS